MREDMLGVETVEHIDNLKECCQVFRVQPFPAVGHRRSQVDLVLGFKGVNVDIQIVDEDVHQFSQCATEN